MLKIRKEQMDALEAHMMGQYEQRVLRKIRATFPEWYESAGAEQACLLIQTGVRQATGYAITEDDDVERFILLLVRHGLAFEKRPEMLECLEILEDPDLPGDAKVSMIWEEPESEGNTQGQG